MSKVVVVGQGYVGLPMSLSASEAGHQVFGLDLNEETINSLISGKSHIDDISNESLADALRRGYLPTTDPICIAEADVVVVCVPTPLSEGGGPDLSAVESAAEVIGRYIPPGTLCVLESTTYPGTTEEIFAPLVCVRGLIAGESVSIAFSPERIDPGNKTFNVKNTPKVVGGVTESCTQHAKDFYSSFIDVVVAAKGAREAEMAKLLENTFRHVNIALMNEMVRFSRELDIDLWNAIDVAETKPFGFMAFRPGPGVGGHCIPVDPSYLSHRVKAKLGYAFRMVELAEEINHAAPTYVAERVRTMLNDYSKPVRGARVLLLGVSYKADISDMRETPAQGIAETLRSWGADIQYYDPYVPVWPTKGYYGENLISVEDPLSAAKNSDVVVLIQNHKVFELSEISAVAPLMLDTRGVMEECSRVVRL